MAVELPAKHGNPGCSESDFEGHASKRPRLGDVLRLNVGGVLVDVAKSTLEQLPYFRALFEQAERLHRPLEMDQDGRVFVDRDGGLFHIVLQFLRTNQRPSADLLQSERGLALLSEAEFYGCDALKCELLEISHNSWFSVEDRHLREAETAVATAFTSEQSPATSHDFLIDVFQNIDLFRLRDRGTMGYSLLFEERCPIRTMGESAIAVQSPSAFKQRLNRASNRILRALEHEYVVLSGTAVVSALTQDSVREDRELVVSFCDASAEQARDGLNKILTALKLKLREDLGNPAANTGPELRIVRTKGMLTVNLPSRRSPAYPVVKIMLTLYQSPEETVLNAPADCEGVVYVPSSSKVYCTPRCLRALQFRANVVDTQFRGIGYEERLEKLTEFGYCVAVPGLSWSSIDSTLRNQRYKLMHMGKEVLFRVGERISPPQTSVMPLDSAATPSLPLSMDRMPLAEFEIPGIDFSAGPYSVVGAMAVSVVPPSIERLVVLDAVNVERMSCGPRRNAAGDLMGFAPVTAEDGRTALLEIKFQGLAPPPGDEVAPEEEARMRAALKLLRYRFVASHCVPPRALSEPHVSSSFLQFLFLKRHTAREPLGFVWCLTDGESNDLAHVDDAMRKPLHLIPDEWRFLHSYCVERRLEFKRVSHREHAQHARQLHNAVLGAVSKHQRKLFHNVYCFRQDARGP